MKLFFSPHIKPTLKTIVKIHMQTIQLRFLALVLLFLGVNRLELVAQDSPNFILFLTDDQGWSGTSLEMDPNRPASNSDFYLMPRLEQLAQRGMIFSQAYAPAAKCSPTRCSILTGQSTARNQFTYTDNAIASGTRVVEATTIRDIPSTDVTIAEWLKEQGLDYTTAHYGKWHINAGGPSAHGFDRSDGETSNGEGNQGGVSQADPKRIFSLTDSADVFMTEAVQRGRPFYLQLSHYAPHTPTEGRPNSLTDWANTSLHPPGQKHSDAEYGAMLSDLDDGLGLLLDRIEALGIADNTYIIYLSDNGAPGNNRPLRSGKNSCYEGGIRVPMVVAGPSVQAGVYNSTAVVGYDIFPTIIDMVAGNMNDAPMDLDGVSLHPTLVNAVLPALDRNGKEIIFHSPHFNANRQVGPQSAIVDGNYKFVVNYEEQELALYDLDTDLGEEVDLTNQLPAKAQELCLRLRDYLKQVGANRVSLNPAHPNFSGTAPDVDQDGLPDEWEFQELLTDRYGAEDDPDGDGINNEAEWMNGSDPYQAGTTAVSGTQIESESIAAYLSPQPFDEELNLKIRPSFQQENLSIALYNVAGQKMLEEQTAGTSLITLSTAQISPGYYFLKLTALQSMKTEVLAVIRQ